MYILKIAYIYYTTRPVDSWIYIVMTNKSEMTFIINNKIKQLFLFLSGRLSLYHC